MTRTIFEAVRVAAIPALPVLVRLCLPGGERQKWEWMACNPRRKDRTPGSSKVNLRTGRWADFAAGDKGAI